MAKLINASICLTDIDKEKITIGKNGKKYLQLTVSLNDEKDKYDNDCGIYHSQTKEERESKAKKVFLGNGKVVWSSDTPSAKPAAATEEVDDLPF